ncbi:MAG: globin [Candidatus Melainabacteria bacterium]|nr:MAG: globin [Candidatus Melainabacteria bacterium]
MQALDPFGSIYAKVGSEKPFFSLVEAFYALVEQDEILRPLYPEDLTPAKEHLALFLIQRSGGRNTYSLERGHPRMRARHMPFKIGQKERDAWVKNMNQAIGETPEFTPHKEVMQDFFSEFATFMINQPH